MKKLGAVLFTAVTSIAIYETLRRYGVTDQICGKAEQAIGKATNNPKMQAKGMVHSGKGKVKQTVEEGKDAFQEAIEDFNRSDVE